MTEYPKLDPEIKDKWVTALESGEYKQGEGMLAIPPKLTTSIIEKDDKCKKWRYCCMGVLGCIVGIPNEEMMKYGQFAQLVNKDINEEIANKVRDNISAPLLISSSYSQLTISYKCIDMNDNEHKTFPEIAAWIKENL